MDQKTITNCSEEAFLFSFHNLLHWSIYLYFLSNLFIGIGFILVVAFVSESYIKKEDALIEDKPKASYLTIIKDKGVVITVFLYALEALLQCSFDSLVSLWLSSSREDGGFGLDVKQIGWFICCVCPMQMGNCK